MEEALSKLEKDILAYKSGQDTQGDSANFYVVQYSPGWFVTNNLDQWREHTIKCVPYVNSDKAIFMAQLCPDDITISGASYVGRLPTQPQEIITWWQNAHTSSEMAEPSHAVGIPKSIMIFSNVPFYIETSYVTKSI